MPRSSGSRSKKFAANEGRRQGVVLGLTIAEIILLILFALLLALTGVLIKRQAAIKTQFEAQAIAEAMSQILSPAISAKLLSMGIDVTKKEGESRLLAILDAAQIVSKPSSKEQSRLDQACKAGIELQSALGKNLNAADLIKSAQTLSKDLETLKGDAAKCVTAAIPPPCYEKVSSEPTAFLYDVRVSSGGIVLNYVLPDRYRSRFDADFSNPPPLNKALSNAEFKTATNRFAAYGKSNSCKFYVKVYDETAGSNEKFRASLKVIEESFVWTFMMTTKEDAAGKNINLFPMDSIKTR